MSANDPPDETSPPPPSLAAGDRRIADHEAEKQSGRGAEAWRSLVVVFLIGLALRLWGLGQESLWADEYYTLLTASQPSFGAVMDRVVNAEPHPPLYFLIMHAWLALAGTSDIALRLPSALAGALTVPLLFLLMRLLFPSRPGAAGVAAGLLAFSPMHIWYSQEARAYALLLLVQVGAMALLVAAFRAAEGPDQPGRERRVRLCLIASALMAVALPQMQYYAGLIWMGHLTALFWWGRHRPGRLGTGWVIGLAIMLLGVLMPAWGALKELLAGYYEAHFHVRLGPSVFFHIGRAQWIGPFWSPMPWWVQGLGVAAGAGLAGYGAWLVFGSKRRGSAVALVLGSALFWTFVFPIAFSFIKTVIFYGQRYLVIALPMTVALTAVGVTAARGRGRLLAAALVGILLICQAWWLWGHAKYREKRTWDTVAEHLAAEVPPDVRFVVLPARLAGLLARYFPRRVEVNGADRVAELPKHARPAGQSMVVVSIKDLRPWLSKFYPGRNLVPRVYETHRPAQELWIFKLAGPASAAE